MDGLFVIEQNEGGFKGMVCLGVFGPVYGFRRLFPCLGVADKLCSPP